MKTVAKIALIALLWITVINSGTINRDTDLRLRMAHAWWTGTSEVPLDYRPQERGDIRAGVKGVGGKRYIAYDVGQSILMLPGDWLGTQLYQLFPTVAEKSDNWRNLVVSFSIFVPLNVAAVVSCFWLLKLFEFDEKIAGLTSLVWLFGTTVLHYAQVPQQNNQVLLFVAIGYAAALAFLRCRRPRFAWMSGLALGCAFLIRMSSTVHALTVLLFLVGCIAYQTRDKLKVFRAVGLWIVGFIPLVLIGRIFDYIRFGSFWATAQSLSVQQSNTDPIWSGLPNFPPNYPTINESQVGILGVLFSPAKSIFIYDPLLLPCLILGMVLWKKLSPYMQWYLVTGILNLALHIVLLSRLDFWHGDWAWGARYHVTSVHLLLIPLLGLFIQRLSSARALTAWLMQGILAIAGLVQIASVLMPFNLEIAQEKIESPKTRLEYQTNLGFRLGQRLTNIACLISSSFSEQCIGRLDTDKKRSINYYNKLFFLPFSFTQSVKLSRILLVFWLVALTLAIATTVWFFIWGT